MKQLCIDLEHFETPIWAVEAILHKEILSQNVIDPCCGIGILSGAALKAGYRVLPIDIHDWGYELQSMTGLTGDYLKLIKFDNVPDGFSVLMNPPFSLAEQFVEKSFELGARKIVFFQRFAWWESRKRRPFWEKNPPARVYICGDRADCWRHDIPPEGRGSSTPTAHAWFVWEKGMPPGTLLGHIYK